MLHNFFRFTLRNLIKHKLYTFINIFGLSIGIVCSLLIWLWVADESSYDKFHPKVDRLYQVWAHASFNNKINSWRSVPLPTYEAMKTAHSDIVNSTVTGWGGDRLLSVGEKRLIQAGYYVSEEFLEMFEFPLLVGEPNQVLDDPSSIVITEKLAKMLFGEQDPIGETIRFNNESSLQVTGILKDIPSNSSFEFEYLVPWKQRELVSPWVVRNKTNWGNYSFQIFVELNDPTDHLEVQSAVKNMLTENGETDMPREFILHPMSMWRLHSNFVNGELKEGRNDHVQLFSVIAIFILIIACINFMNLATAKSEGRAREVGIRKSLGSSRSQIVFQFLGESLMISVFAFVLALIMAEFLLPSYNDMLEKTLSPKLSD